MNLKLEKIIRYILLAAVFFPLFYTPFTLFPSYYGKAAIFQILVEIALILYLVLILKGRAGKPKLTAIFYVLAAFVAIRIISGFVGLNAEKSFWGTMARMDGNFTWLHFLAYFYLLTQFFKTKKDWLLILKLSVVAGFLVAITGVMQRFGITPLNWWIREEGGRVFGVIGNSIPFASYILFNIFVCLFLLADVIRDFWKVFSVNKKDLAVFKKEGIVLNEIHLKYLLWIIIWIVILATEIIALIWSGTRGPIISFFAAIPLFVLFYGATSRKKVVRGVFLSVILISVILGAVLGFFYVRDNNQLFAADGAMQKALRIFGANGDIGTLNTRLMNWRSAYAGWTGSVKSIVIGYGPENYDRIFDKFYKADLLSFSFYETVGDKPHNIVLEMLTVFGFPGLMAYVALFIIIGFAVIKASDKNIISRVSAVILMLAFATYFLQNLFEFDTANVLLMFFLTSAFVSCLERKNATEDKIKAAKIFVAPAIIAVVAIGFLGSVAPMRASYFMVEATTLTLAPEDYLARVGVSAWAENIQKALLAPSVYEDEIRVHAANQMFNMDARGLFDISPLNIKDLELLGEKMKETNIKHPGAYAYKHRLAQVLGMMGTYIDKKYFSESEEMFKELDAENPERQAVGLSWGQMRLASGDHEGAIEVLQKLADKNPKSDSIFIYYGLALLGTGHEEDGLAALEKSLSLGGYLFTRDDFIDILVSLWQKNGEYQKIISLYSNLVEQQGMNEPKRAVVWLTRLAATYARVGEKDNAIEAAKKAAAIDPAYSEATQKFIESLDK